MSKERLLLREWCALMVALSLFVSLITLCFRWGVPEVTGYGEVPLVQVTVQGAVLRPGVYRVRPGLLLKDLLKLAGRQKGADLSGISLKRPICGEETIDVPLREKKKLRYAPRSKVERKA